MTSLGQVEKTVHFVVHAMRTKTARKGMSWISMPSSKRGPMHVMPNIHQRPNCRHCELPQGSEAIQGFLSVALDRVVACDFLAMTAVGESCAPPAGLNGGVAFPMRISG